MKISRSVTPGQKERLQTIGRAINEIERRTRAGKIDPNLLKKLGMTEQQLSQFVKRYTDKFDKIRKPKMKKDAKPPLPEEDVVSSTSVQTGSKKLQKGTAIEKGMSDVTGTSKHSADDIRKLYESSKVKISPEYRKHVEAYLRAISENAPREKE